MKKNMKSLIAGGVVLATLTGMLALPSLATVGQKLLRADYHDMKVTLNGEALKLTDSSGNPVEPFTIDGTTYLPLACISQALGVDVAWDGPNNTVVLTTEEKTTAPAASASGTSQSAGDIGVEKAKSAALKHAGLAADEVTFIKAKLDYDNGVRVYDVEFWADSKEYDYEIDAATGSVRSYDFDVEGYTAQSSNDIGVEKAKSAALKHAGLSADEVTFVKARLDYDDGMRVYDVEFWAGSKEYDYEIDAATGAVRSCDWDIEDNAPASSGSASLTEAQVKAIVEKKAGTTGTYRDFHLDRDDGRLVYEGELRSNGLEYEFEIDAATGAILDWDVDWD